MRRWKAHRGKIASLSFSRDGRLLASVTGSGQDVFIWHALTGELVRKLTVEDVDGKPSYSSAAAICFGPDADLLAVARRNYVEVWETGSWVRTAEAVYGYGTPGAVALGPGPRPRVAASTGSDTNVYDLPDPSPAVAVFRGVSNWESEYHTQLTFTADATGVGTHTIHAVEVREVTSGTLLLRFRHRRANYSGPVRFSPDSSRLAFCSTKTIESHPATFDDPADVIRYAGHTNKVWVLRYTPDGRSLISASSDGTVRVWEAATGLQKQCFEMNVGKMLCADVSPDGTMAAVGGATGEIVVWDLE